MNPDHSTGYFIVPATFLDELHQIEDEANQALDANHPDMFWRWNQLFQRAHDVAVKSVVISGDYHPWDNEARGTAHLLLVSWLQQEVLDGDCRQVLDPDRRAHLADAFRRTSFDDFHHWVATVGSKQHGEVEHVRLTELYEGLARILHEEPRGPHGLVYADFLEKHRHPPEPPPEPTISRADAAVRGQRIVARFEQAISRQRRPWWVDEPHAETRVLLGLLPPDRVDELAEAYRRAWEMFTGDEVRAGLAALEREVIPRVEAALLDPVIETVGGPVEALHWLRAYLRWKTKETPAAIFSPEQAAELDALLERLLDDEALDWIHEQERHWTRALIRDTCERFRQALGRALATGHGFVWLLDEYGRERP